MNSPPLLRFFHYTYGQDVGTLGVYLRPGCIDPADWSLADIPTNTQLIWEITESQNNAWTEVELILDMTSSSDPFQVSVSMN